MTVGEAARKMVLAVDGLVRRGLWAESHTLVEWLKRRPFVAAGTASGIDFDPWTELVLLEITSIVSQPRPQPEIRRAVHDVYRIMGIPIPER